VIGARPQTVVRPRPSELGHRSGPSRTGSARWGGFCAKNSQPGTVTCPPVRRCCAPSASRSTPFACSSSDRPLSHARASGRLSFSVAPGVRPIPRSLVNIYNRVDDRSRRRPTHLRRSHPVGRPRRTPSQSRAHRAAQRARVAQGKGWEEVTAAAIDALVARGGPSSRSSGTHARSLATQLRDIPMVESAHPSPLSAARRILRLRPFSRTNALLAHQGADPVDWRLP